MSPISSSDIVTDVPFSRLTVDDDGKQGAGQVIFTSPITTVATLTTPWTANLTTIRIQGALSFFTIRLKIIIKNGFVCLHLFILSLLNWFY